MRSCSRKAGRDPIERRIFYRSFSCRGTTCSVGGDLGFSSSFMAVAPSEGSDRSNSFSISSLIFRLSWTGITLGIEGAGLWIYMFVYSSDFEGLSYFLESSLETYGIVSGSSNIFVCSF
jgi:hypothetical protein